jgi:predicted porin
MGGVTVALLYQPDEGRKDSSVKDLTAVLAGPAGPGKMLVGLGWASHGKAWNNDEKAESNLRFAGSFEISDFKIGLLYQKASNMNTVPTTAAGCAAQTVTVTTTNIATTPVSTGVTTNTSTVATATPACTTANTIKAVTAESLDRTTWGLGGSYKIGAGAVKAQYYKAGESKGAAVDPADGATMIAIGYDHNLSKNTKLYVAFSKTKNDDNGTLGPAGSGNNIPTKGSGYTAAAAGHSPNNVVAGTNANTINNGSDPKALSVGMVFTF